MEGVLIPNTETAVNLVMDTAPVLGENIVVFGQGVVGLLTTALLARHPLGALYTVEPKAARRERSTAFGADRSFPPDAGDALSDALDLSHHGPQSVEGVAAEGADAIIELSGRPGVLNQALEIIGFDGRILLGSWYGTRRAPIDLGERFHRSRVSIVSSQVSTIASKYRGRWNKDRRMNTVLDLLPEMDAQTLIGEPVSIHQAPVIYDRLHQGDAQLQPIFKYT
jgi:threonine dehydrogenase-like Zn-dependent dehydrogenase